MEETKHEKIIFRFYSELFDKEIEESLWAFELDKENRLYQLDSIPIYVPLIASNDIVFADLDATTNELIYNKTISYSGHSTIQVILADESRDLEEIRETFSKLRCISEKVNDTFFVLDVPDDVNYEIIKAELDELEADEIIEYAEPSLSEQHRQQTS
jgi:hypothetical protein